MKISEVIEKLQSHLYQYGDLPVLVSGYESGYNEFSLAVENVKENQGGYWEGSYTRKYGYAETDLNEVQSLAVIFERS